MKLLAFAIAAAACGTEDNDNGITSLSDAQVSVQQVAKLTGALPSMDNMFVEILAMGAANQAVVIPRVGPYTPRGGFPRWSATTTPNIGSVECMAGSCTFTGYGYSELYKLYKIDGTITRSGDTSTFDLTPSFTDYSDVMHWMISGSVTTTSTRVDGTIRSHGVGRSSHGNTPLATWALAIDYAAITLDAQGCPTSGAVHAVTSYVHATGDDLTQDGGTPSFRVEATVPLGPACN